MGRSRKSQWRVRLIAALLLAAMVGAAAVWWHSRHWKPERTAFPVQGALVGERDGAVDLAALRSIGADFVYIEASSGASGRDTQLGRNLAEAEAIALPHGVLHAWDPCVDADVQAANFVTIVPRDAQMLPPAISLEATAESCGDPVREAGMESELTTFINQVESHVGQPVVLKVSPAFEARYGIAMRIDRNLWLERDWMQPGYAGRPWTLWTANGKFSQSEIDEPLRWVVVQP